MAPKSTQKKLSERDEELKPEAVKFLKIGGVFNRKENYLQAIIENINQPVFIKTSNYQYLFINHRYERLANISNDEIVGKTDFDIFPNHIATLFRSQDERVVEHGSSLEFKESVQLADGEYSFITYKFPLIDNMGKIYAIGGVCTDITKLQKAEEALIKAHDELEEMVQKRTAELEENTRNLEETNIALKILLQQRENDKKNLEKDVLFNVNKLIQPSLERLHNDSLSTRQKNCLNVIETNLNEITASFSSGMSNKLQLLTPSQIQVADLIKQGKTTKEIASLLNLSPATIACHRQEIRKKMSLTGKKLNLQTALTTTT